MNKILMLVGIAIAALAVWLLVGRGRESASPSSPAATPTTASGSASATAPAPAPAAKPAPVGKVGRVSAEERQRLADQIARARAERAAPSGGGASSTTPRPSLPEDGEADATLVRTTMKDAMREVIPYLADCYDKAGDKLPAAIKVAAEITLTGDPDVGTLIDTNRLSDGDGKPLEPSFDTCLKDAFASLQMPPLSEGGEVKVRYPFVFTRDDSDAPSGSGNLPP